MVGLKRVLWGGLLLLVAGFVGCDLPDDFTRHPSIYFANGTDHEIFRLSLINKRASSIDVSEAANPPNAIALDLPNGHLYFATLATVDDGANLYRVNLDGSDLVLLAERISAPIVQITDIAVDPVARRNPDGEPVGRRVYNVQSNFVGTSLWAFNLDSSASERLFSGTTGFSNPAAIEFDSGEGTLFITGAEEIFMLNFERDEGDSIDTSRAPGSTHYLAIDTLFNRLFWADDARIFSQSIVNPSSREMLEEQLFFTRDIEANPLNGTLYVAQGRDLMQIPYTRSFGPPATFVAGASDSLITSIAIQPAAR